MMISEDVHLQTAKFHRVGQSDYCAFGSTTSASSSVIPDEAASRPANAGLENTSSKIYCAKTDTSHALEVFVRAIKNGEAWSPACQQAYECALSALNEARTAPESTEVARRAILAEAVTAVRLTPHKRGITPDGFGWTRLPTRSDFIASIEALMPPESAPRRTDAALSKRPAR